MTGTWFIENSDIKNFVAPELCNVSKLNLNVVSEYFWVPKIYLSDFIYTSSAAGMPFIEFYHKDAFGPGFSSYGGGTFFYSYKALRCISLPNLEKMNISSYSPTLYSESSTYRELRVYAPKLRNARCKVLFNLYASISKERRFNAIAFPSLEQCIGSIVSQSNKTSVNVYLPSIKTVNTLVTATSSSYKFTNASFVIGSDSDTEPATLAVGVSTNASNTPSSTIDIYVPDHLVDAYKTATNWSVYADSIKPQSDITDEMWDDINSSLQQPTPPQEYVDWLTSVGVDYYAERERLLAEAESKEATA